MIENSSPVIYKFTSPRSAAVLKVIHELALEIADSRDPGLAMQAIVQRTRTLLAADIAHIYRYDLVAGDISPAWSVGARTSEYVTNKVPLGFGVAGLIATGRPTFSSDYLADDHIIHHPAADQVTASEGVRAVMGVPILVRGRVAGALTIEHRARGVLSPPGRSALEQIATVASVVMGQILDAEANAKTVAQAMEEDAAKSVRLQRAEQLLALDDLLLPTLSGAHNVSQILKALASDLEQALGLYSPDGDLIAGSAVLPPSVGVGQYSRLSIVGRASTAAAEPATLTAENTSFTVIGISASGEYLGAAVVEGVDEAQSDLLSRGAKFLAAALLTDRILVDADARPGSMLIERLLGGAFNDRPVGILKRLAQHGIVDQGDLSILCVLGERRALWGLFTMQGVGGV